MSRPLMFLALLLALVFTIGCPDDGDDDAGDDTDDDDADDDDAGDDTGDDSGDDTDDDADDDTGDDDDAVPPEVVIPCLDAREDVYVTPGDLPPFDPTQRGAVVRCAPDGSASREEVALRLAQVPGIDIESGFVRYLMAYRTERDPGVAGVGTLRLFVPDTPAPGPLPIVVAAHGTVGLADYCAPSHFEETMDDLLLPWLAAGYPTVAPDYAGMGNEGVQGYGNTPDTVHSAIDAVRAAMRALAPGSVDGRFVIAGHSQGGGVSIGTQALAASYGAPDLALTAAVAFAAGYSTRSHAQGMRFPQAPIDGGGGVARAVQALVLYADFANLFGVEHARDPLHPALREALGQAIETKCIFPLVAWMAEPHEGYTPPMTLGELVDPTFRAEVVDCLNGLPSCTPRASAYVARSEASRVYPDPAGAPLLMVAGSQDVQVPPVVQACLREELRDAGLEPEVCYYEGADHFSIVATGTAYAIDWALNGGAPCPSDAELPECPL